MKTNRTAANIDANQPDIVEKLRKISGVQVELNHDDILVGYQGRNFWFEIKNPDRCLRKDGTINPKEISDKQIDLAANWPGHYQIVWSIDQILQTIFTDKGEA